MDPWIIETSNQTPQVVNPALWCLLTCVAKFLAVGFNKHSKEELDVDELFRASAPPKLSCLHLGSDYFEAVCTPACTRHEPHPHSCVVFRFFFFFFFFPSACRSTRAAMYNQRRLYGRLRNPRGIFNCAGCKKNPPLWASCVAALAAHTFSCFVFL
jgi:hypothetical protein